MSASNQKNNNSPVSSAWTEQTHRGTCNEFRDTILWQLGKKKKNNYSSYL